MRRKNRGEIKHALMQFAWMSTYVDNHGGVGRQVAAGKRPKPLGAVWLRC